MPRNLIEKIYNQFGKGTVNFVEAENISDGAASSSSNFLTEQDRIILTYGRKRIGDEYAGSSPVLGLHSITKLDGTDLIIRKVGATLQYYNTATDVWTTMTSGLDTTEKLWFDNYYSANSRQIWASGKDGLFKIYPSHPTNVLTMTNSAKNFKGKIRIENRAMWTWGVPGSPLVLRRSKFDVDSNQKKPSVYITATDTGGEILTHSRVTMSSADTNTDVVTHSGEIVINTGDLIVFSNSGGAVPTGLVAGTQYWAIKLSNTTIKIASTVENANNAVAIDLTSAGSGTNTIKIGLIDIQTKDKVTIVSSATMPGGVTSGATYWAIRVSDTQIKLAVSFANAGAGTAVDLTAAGTGTVILTVTHDFVGASGATSYSGTLKSGNISTVTASSGSKSVTDNFNGLLTSVTSDGTGTINYATGAYTIVFATNTTSEVYITYTYEEPLNGGIADFTYSTIRSSTDGFSLVQAAVGTQTYGVISFDGKTYSLQDRGAYRVSISADGLTINNDIFSGVVSCASDRSYIQVSDGIIFLNIFDSAKPQLSKLTYNLVASDKMLPINLSEQFKMDGYYFDKSSMVLFNDMVVYSCRTKNSTVNNRTIVYRLTTKSFDVLNVGYDWLEVANNKLIGGDSISPNVYELFSGFDDLDFSIVAEWIGKNDTLDSEQLKKYKKFWIEGYIAPGQSFDIYFKYDRAAWELVGSIDSLGSYVDTGSGVTVGTALYAENMLGGEGDGTIAYFYKHMIKVRPPKFSRVQFKIVPTGIGYLSVNQLKYSDIRLKGFKVLKKYK